MLDIFINKLITLQGYLNLYCFMNSNHVNKLEKVNDFIELVLTTTVTLNYRKNFEKKKKNNH